MPVHQWGSATRGSKSSPAARDLVVVAAVAGCSHTVPHCRHGRPATCCDLQQHCSGYCCCDSATSCAASRWRARCARQCCCRHCCARGGGRAGRAPRPASARWSLRAAALRLARCYRRCRQSPRRRSTFCRRTPQGRACCGCCCCCAWRTEEAQVEAAAEWQGGRVP